jgi:hypothetical protein
MPHDPHDGWRWFAPDDAGPPRQAEPAPEAERLALARAVARCFATPEGEALLRHLTDLTLRRTLGPDASDAQLRQLEGQRQLVAYLHALAARGRAGA